MKSTLSVLISVYGKESPAFLSEALLSIQKQTLRADEVVIVKDGPLGAQLDRVIAEYCERLPVVVVQLAQNVGLGEALRIGVTKCAGELVARMDSDDICDVKRFELQARVFAANPDVDVVGGAIAEFSTDPAGATTVRRLPTSSADIVRYAKSRNPLNHMTVMFRREAVLRAGNYQPYSDFEDYHLWARMLVAGSRIVNLDDVVVYARVGNGMLGRRAGLRYLRTEIAFQRFLSEVGLITRAKSLCNILLRAPIRVAPLALRKLVYENLLRSPFVS